MKIEVMDVLQYIFERFQDDEVVPVAKAEKLVTELEEVGFKTNEIDSALDWLDGLVEISTDSFAPSPLSTQSTRIFHPYEEHFLDVEARGFIYFLEQAGVLDLHAREAVIDRVLALQSDKPLDLEQLKWVILMVLCNTPGNQAAAAWLENMDEAVH